MVGERAETRYLSHPEHSYELRFFKHPLNPSINAPFLSLLGYPLTNLNNVTVQ